MNQSFQQVFVTNTGSLLSSGTTSDLAVGQVSFFDGESYRATATPTFFQNKSLIVGWGYPDIKPAALLSGQFNENEKSPAIFGRRIKKVRTFKAKHPRKEIVVAGNTGDVADTDTIVVKPGETKAFYLRLTGSPIDKLYSTQGLIRRYIVKGDCINDCADGCTDSSDPRRFVQELAKQITEDPKVAGLVKATTIINCTPSISETTTNCYVFHVSLCDDGTDTALGFIQSQYPGEIVVRSGRDGATSTYEITRSTNTTPAAASNAGLTIIPDCPTCPSGYTLVPSGYVYEVKRADAGSSGNLTTVASDYSIAGSETAARISYQNGVSTYILVSSVTLTVVGTDQFKFVGQARNSCVITSATTTAWALFDTLVKYQSNYRIQLKDTVCGSNRLTELQAAFPALVVSVVDAGGSCVHTYETTISSNCVKPGCSAELIQFVTPDPFDGVSWVQQPVAALVDGTACLVGLQLESAWVDRITNECTYDAWPYEADGVHIEFSEFDANYNGAPQDCKVDGTKVKLIQSLQYPQGSGQFIRKLEERSKELFLKTRSYQPIVREIEGYQFVTDPTKYYDQITVEFDYSYPVGSFSERYSDSYHLNLFVLEGKGGSIVSALNSYITSPEIGLDAVVL